MIFLDFFYFISTKNFIYWFKDAIITFKLIDVTNNYRVRIKAVINLIFVIIMHPEIEEILNSASHEFFIADARMLLNAGRILNYIDDINLERTGRFEPTPAESLYLLWNAEDLEFHIECLNNGCILYTFRKNGRFKASGLNTIDEFIPQLENYLLTGIC